MANFGWGAELLPTRGATFVGWLRIGRWGSAVLASVLELVSLLLGITFAPVYGLVILGTGLPRTFEFAPGGPANKP
jgi:hypothetical protein